MGALDAVMCQPDGPAGSTGAAPSALARAGPKGNEDERETAWQEFWDC